MSELTTNSVSNPAKRVFEEIRRGSEIILVKVNPKDYTSVLTETLKLLTSMYDGVYIALNKPTTSIIKHFERENVNVERLVFIDCITAQFGQPEEIDNCIFLESPNPVQIAVYVERAVEMLKSNIRFVYMDSLSTISLYKSPETLIKFMRQLTGRLRIVGVIGVFFVINGEIETPYLAQISLMCDSIIEG